MHTPSPKIREPKKQLEASGFSLIELMIAMAIVAITAVSSTVLFQIVGASDAKSKTFQWLDDVRIEAQRDLQSKEAWQNTINDVNNLSTACLKDVSQKTSCSGAGGPIRLRNKANELIRFLADPATPNFGVSEDGRVCFDFDSVTGNDFCPFRFNVSWRAICQSAECLNPQIEVSGRLTYKPRLHGRTFNPNRFNFSVVLGEKSTELNNACLSMGGVPDAIDPNICNIDAHRSCPPDQFILGFNSLGQAKCGTVYPTSVQCPLGEFVNGINPDGSPRCSPGCGVVNWVRPMPTTAVNGPITYFAPPPTPPAPPTPQPSPTPMSCPGGFVLGAVMGTEDYGPDGNSTRNICCCSNGTSSNSCCTSNTNSNSNSGGNGGGNGI